MDCELVDDVNKGKYKVDLIFEMMLGWSWVDQRRRDCILLWPLWSRTRSLSYRQGTVQIITDHQLKCI